jgi:hypothetical protein
VDADLPIGKLTVSAASSPFFAARRTLRWTSCNVVRLPAGNNALRSGDEIGCAGIPFEVPRRNLSPDGYCGTPGPYIPQSPAALSFGVPPTVSCGRQISGGLGIR